MAALQLDTALIKTASRCNYDCSYCYVYQSADTSWKSQPKRMSFDTIDAVVKRLVDQADKQDAGFAVVLHGGEPLLLGYEGLSRLIGGLRQNLRPEKYPISVQTNGALINDKILDLFSAQRVSVSVSIDGSKSANDIARVDHKGNSTFEKTVQGIEALKSHPDKGFLFAGTLSVIQPIFPAEDTYIFLKALGSPSMDFLLQDGNYDSMPVGKQSFGSVEYGEWLSELFNCYVLDENPVPIRYFDDIIRLILGGYSLKEGRGVEPYGILIIESNGEIRKNDTLRSSFDGADSFSMKWNVSDVEISEVLASAEFLDYSNMQVPTASTCKSCEYFDVCGGGMPLYRFGKEHGYNAPSIYCSDHKLIIKTIIDRLNCDGYM